MVLLLSWSTHKLLFLFLGIVLIHRVLQQKDTLVPFLLTLCFQYLEVTFKKFNLIMVKKKKKKKKCGFQLNSNQTRYVLVWSRLECKTCECLKCLGREGSEKRWTPWSVPFLAGLWMKRQGFRSGFSNFSLTAALYPMRT